MMSSWCCPRPLQMLQLWYMCRRLDDLPHEANRVNHKAAERVVSSSEQARHEAEIAALGLAILVRLTSHAGVLACTLHVDCCSLWNLTLPCWVTSHADTHVWLQCALVVWHAALILSQIAELGPQAWL